MSAAGRRRPRAERLAAWVGVAAFAVVMAGCLWSALGYTGRAGEPYSPLNHWISELGQEGVAARAGAFNVGLRVGGVAFIAFVAGLALTSPSRLRWAFGLAGVIAGAGGVLVGIFPMNRPAEHVLAASIFFNLGWIFVGLASIAFVRNREPRHPARLAVVGALSVAAFVAFLVSLRVDEYARARMASSGALTARPDLWIAPILEWAALLGIMAWVLLTSIAWLRALWRAGREPMP